MATKELPWPYKQAERRDKVLINLMEIWHDLDKLSATSAPVEEKHKTRWTHLVGESIIQLQCAGAPVDK